MTFSLETSLIGAAATGVLAASAIGSGALTREAGIVAATFGVALVVFGGYPYLALMTLFVVASVLATRYGIEEKVERHVQEGTRGERGVANVVAHVIAPTGIAFVGFVAPSLLAARPTAFLYTSALAFGAADTFASELGVLSGGARSILTFRPVPAGTNGGVSVLGTLWAVVGAATTAGVGLGLFLVFGAAVPASATFVVGVTVAGFLGCQIDSVLGATLENRGFLTKGSTNFLAMMGTIALAYAFLATASGVLA